MIVKKTVWLNGASRLWLSHQTTKKKKNVSVLSLHSWLHKDTFFGVWHLADIPLYNGKGFWTFLVFEDGLRCRFRHYNHPFKGWKLVLETVYFEGWCTSKQVEKVLKVKLKFRGSKSGRPTDDLLWSSGRPTAILGVRTPGRPLNLHAECVDQMFWLEFNGCQGTSGGIVRARYPCIEVRGQCIWWVTGNQSLNSSYHCRQPNGKHYCNLVPAALIKNVKILVSYQWIGWKRGKKMVGE